MASFGKSIWVSTIYSYPYILLYMNSFWIHVVYFVSIGGIGCGILKLLHTRTHDYFIPRTIDFFFTSVSAVTVSSMSAVEMEVFSNAQLLVMIVLMFIGGEIFTSMVGLFLSRYKFTNSFRKSTKLSRRNTLILTSSPINVVGPVNHHIELSHVLPKISDSTERPDDSGSEKPEPPVDQEDLQSNGEHLQRQDSEFLRYNDSKKLLRYIILGYLLVVQIIGVAFVLIYLNIFTKARNVLEKKGINQFTFSLFLIVSTFSSCGFVPTNENMMVFKKNSGLLLIIIPQILMGNTLYPSCLRFCIWIIAKLFKKEEGNYLLKRSREMGYMHLLPALHSSLLVVTVLGFLLVQVMLFCSMEWYSTGLSGLNWYQKIVGGLFMAANSRHTGETIVDFATVAPAVLVLFVVMMYLPPYTSYLPVIDDDETEEAQMKKENMGTRKRRLVWDNVILSQLSYLLIFIILICIIERKNMSEDPLNYSVLNIVIEVISAYGNVGFSTGYSCNRRLQPDSKCVDKSYGFAGKWSDPAKLILIVVMFFGRVKKFNMNGGKAWKLM